MRINEFIEQVKEDIERDSPKFIANLEAHPLDNMEKTFCEWMPIFLAWMDYGSNCDRYYGHRK
jgi:hypothetical protein